MHRVRHAALLQLRRSHAGLLGVRAVASFEYYNARKIEGSIRQDSGATIRDAVKAAVQFGVIPEAELPYNVAHFTKRPTRKMYVDAKRFQVLEYLRVINAGTSGLNAIKTCITAGYPIVFGATLYESFEQPGPGADGMIPMPKPGEQVLGGHCQCIVGYDDKKQAFLIANSWGTGWALHGYEWMPYAYLTNTNLADDFWTLRKVQAPS
jgi:C1A family cysteine protease